MQLFISYAHADETFVQQLDAALAQHNIEAWYDRKPGVGLQGGQTWQQRLQAELRQRPVVVVVLSPEAVRPGAFVENEYLFALGNGAIVVPLLYKDCSLPLALTSLQYIDFAHKSFATACDELYIARLPLHLLPRCAPSRPIPSPTGDALTTQRASFGARLNSSASLTPWADTNASPLSVVITPAGRRCCIRSPCRARPDSRRAARI